MIGGKSCQDAAWAMQGYQRQALRRLQRAPCRGAFHLKLEPSEDGRYHVVAAHHRQPGGPESGSRDENHRALARGCAIETPRLIITCPGVLRRVLAKHCQV